MRTPKYSQHHANIDRDIEAQITALKDLGVEAHNALERHVDIDPVADHIAAIRREIAAATESLRVIEA